MIVEIQMLSITSMFIHHPLPSIFPCSCAVPLGVRRHVGPRGQGLGPHGRGPLVIGVHDLTTPLSAIPPLAVGLKRRLKTRMDAADHPRRAHLPHPLHLLRVGLDVPGRELRGVSRPNDLIDKAEKT